MSYHAMMEKSAARVALATPENKRADDRFAKGVNVMVMLAQQSALDGASEQRDDFLAVAHELRTKRFQAARKERAG